MIRIVRYRCDCRIHLQNGECSPEKCPIHQKQVHAVDTISDEEDYPGQYNERVRQRAIQQAVESADRIICDAGDGSVEELMYLTAEVSRRFAEKVVSMTMHPLGMKDLKERTK